MVIITYSQPKMKVRYKDKISRIFNLVKTMATPDLWVKVFFYNKKVYEHWGFNWDKDSPQLQFYFGDRFKLGNVWVREDLEYFTYNGHYRYAEVCGHGFYDEEWDFIKKHPKIKHVITLKITDGCSDKQIANLIAHEYRHYMQFKKYGLKMIARYNDGKRPVQVENDANKWAKKRVESLIKEGKI